MTEKLAKITGQPETQEGRMSGRTWERSSIRQPVVTAGQFLVLEEVEKAERRLRGCGGARTVSIDLSVDAAGSEEGLGSRWAGRRRKELQRWVGKGMHSEQPGWALALTPGCRPPSSETGCEATSMMRTEMRFWRGGGGGAHWGWAGSTRTASRAGSERAETV